MRVRLVDFKVKESELEASIQWIQNVTNLRTRARKISLAPNKGGRYLYENYKTELLSDFTAV